MIIIAFKLINLYEDSCSVFLDLGKKATSI